MEILQELLKSFLLFSSPKKWTKLQEFARFASKREAHFHETINYIQDFYHEKTIFPTLESIVAQLNVTQELEFLGYIQAIQTNGTLRVYQEEATFFTQIDVAEKICLELALGECFQTYSQKIQVLEKKDKESYLLEIDKFVTSLHKVKDQHLKKERPTSGLLYGPKAIEEVQNLYLDILERRKNKDSLYYTLGWEKFKHVKLTPGDLIVIGGFTSHGKSVFLRNLCYHLMVEYCLNVFYSTIEMSYDIMRLLFVVLHANNKKIFPGTPPISFEKIRDGELTPEETDFFLNIVIPDFLTESKYGNLYLEYPNKSRYRLSDIRARITDLENSVMPVEVVGIDYITMLYPLDNDRGAPTRNDYNEMIKEFKNLAMSHTDCCGNSKPFIGITPAQISRGGLSEALKNNQSYDLSALREYNELESSADIVFTVLMLPEMRPSQQLKLQNLKNRCGAVDPDTKEFCIGLSHGFNITEMKTRTVEENIERLKSLKI